MSKNIDQLISAIPIWQNKIIISKVDGGITNQNFLVEDGVKKFFVRVGKDIPEHLVYRSNEIISPHSISEGKSLSCKIISQSLVLKVFIS